MTAPDRPAWHVPHRLRVGTRTAIALVSLLVILGSGLAWSAYRGFTANVAHGLPLPGLAPGQKDLDGAAQNILLVGNDSRAGATAQELQALSTQDDGGSVNTDTMMLLHIPADGGTPSVVSFPRDAWVDIPDNGKGKLNSAYSDGYVAAQNRHENETAAESSGLVMLARTIGALTGLHVDHYVQVNLLGFYRISESIGGVPVCLLHAQNPDTDSDADGRGYSGIDLPAGTSVIEGKQALAFVRQRHGLPNGDLDRIHRQQYFLASAFHKIERAGTLLNPFKLHKLLDAVSSSLLTDPGLNLVSLAQQFQDIGTGSIRFVTLPNQGSQTIYPDGVMTSIVGVDTAAIPGFVAGLAGKPAAPAAPAVAAAKPASVDLDVLNGTDITGLAGQNATTLRARGFHVETIDTTNATPATVVEYPTGSAAAAKAVAAAVPGASLVATDSVPRVTLVLGANGVVAGGKSSAPASGPSAASSPVKSGPAASAGLGCIN